MCEYPTDLTWIASRFRKKLPLLLTAVLKVQIIYILMYVYVSHQVIRLRNKDTVFEIRILCFLRLCAVILNFM